jgi:hypothetical protein
MSVRTQPVSVSEFAVMGLLGGECVIVIGTDAQESLEEICAAHTKVISNRS